LLKKTVTYEDPFTNVEVTEDLYFNLTKAELVAMEVSIPGDTSLKDHLEAIAQAQNGQQIMDAMEWIIFRAYGKRTDNGKFVKNDQLREEFRSSEAYSELFMSLVTDADAAVEFVSGIIPKGLVDEAQEQLPVDTPNLQPVPQEHYADGVDIRPEPVRLSRQQALDMDREQLRSGLADGRYILS
jgi:hypothetical protein